MSRPDEGALSQRTALQARDFTDGLSHTIALAEVKAFTCYYRNAGLADPPIPLAPADIGALGGDFRESGHTEWVDGRCHQTGFTSVFTPNTPVKVAKDGVENDVDWVNQREKTSTTIPTCAAVTARSYHSNLVNALLMDVSVTSFQNDIDTAVWHALSTRAGREVVSASP
jgi:hypothetical protein